MQSSAPFPAAASEAQALSGGDVYVFPASFSQKGLWLVDQLGGGGTAYNLPILWRIAGPLQPRVLERVLEEIVRRHEVLRTTLLRRQGELVQVIAPAARFTLVEEDLSRVAESEREARALERAHE